MKKLIALMIILLFAIGLIPAAFGRELTAAAKADLRDDASASSNKSAEVSARNSARIEAKAELKDLRKEYSERIKNLKESQREKLEAISDEGTEAFANLSSERLEKIAELDKRQIKRLSALKIRNLEKITELKKERLERLSELEQDKLEKISDLSQAEIEKFSELSRARLKNLAKLDSAAIKAELKAIHFVKVRNANDLNKKNVTGSEFAQLKARFEKSKENFKAAKDELNEEKKALNEAKKERNENASIEHAKEYLAKFADALTSHLEKLKVKVQENQNIDDSTEAKIVAEIDVQISDIAKIKSESQAAITKGQVKEAAKKLREKWNTLKHFIDLHAKRVVAARVEGIVNQGLVLEKRLDNLLAKAKEKGIEINATAEISTFSQQIAASREKYLAAQAKISEAFDLRAKGEPADSEKIKTLLQEAEQLLKESRESLASAHETLKGILRMVKTAMPDADLSADVEVEVEQESD